MLRPSSPGRTKMMHYQMWQKAYTKLPRKYKTEIAFDIQKEVNTHAVLNVLSLLGILSRNVLPSDYLAALPLFVRNQQSHNSNSATVAHPAMSAMRLAIRLAAAFSGSFAKCAYLAVVSTLL